MEDGSVSDNQVYEVKKTVLKSPVIFAGFVGAGLVGPLSVGHMIDKLKLEGKPKFCVNDVLFASCIC